MDKLDTSFNFHQTSLRILGQRQSILASNIANEDTPGYRARDIPFATTLNQMLSKQTEASSGLALIPQFRQAVQPSADGNTVDSNIERQQFIDNAIRYETSLTLMRSDVKDMLLVLQG
jgi:flagellar basal-body rod protein FlgB